MPSTIRSQTLTDAVMVRLSGLTGVEIYRGEVDSNPPTLPDSDRVAPYAVLYPFPAKPGPGGDLGGLSDDLDYTFQLTCAAGFETDCERVTDRAHQLLFRWVPVVAGLTFGPLVPPPGYDPGPVRIDRTIVPPRFSVPLQYRSVATAN